METLGVWQCINNSPRGRGKHSFYYVNRAGDGEAFGQDLAGLKQETAMANEKFIQNVIRTEVHLCVLTDETRPIPGK